MHEKKSVEDRIKRAAVEVRAAASLQGKAEDSPVARTAWSKEWVEYPPGGPWQQNWNNWVKR